MVNPREDEPLVYLRFEASTGKAVATPVGGAIEARGIYTISLLELDARPDLDQERRQKYWRVVDYLTRIVDPTSSGEVIEAAWGRLQEELHPRRPYLAIVQQLFTHSTETMQPLIERLYQIQPEAREVLAAFQRPVPRVPGEEQQ